HDFSRRMLQRAQRAFPAKCAYLGDACLQRVLQHGLDSAKQYSLSTERGVAIYLVLMFVLGSEFATDPLVPWAGQVLRDPTLTDQGKRIDRLIGEALRCLKQWLT